MPPFLKNKSGYVSILEQILSGGGADLAKTLDETNMIYMADSGARFS